MKRGTGAPLMPPPPPREDDPARSRKPDNSNPWRWWRTETSHGERVALFLMGWFVTIATSALGLAISAFIAYGLWSIHPLALPGTTAVVAYGGIVIYRITKP